MGAGVEAKVYALAIQVARTEERQRRIREDLDAVNKSVQGLAESLRGIDALAVQLTSLRQNIEDSAIECQEAAEAVRSELVQARVEIDTMVTSACANIQQCADRNTGLLKKHLQDHVAEPRDYGFDDDAWPVDKPHPRIANERVMVAHHRNRVVAMLVFLVGALNPAWAVKLKAAAEAWLK